MRRFPIISSCSRKFIEIQGVSISSVRKKLKGLAGISNIERRHNGAVMVFMTFQGMSCSYGERNKNFKKIKSSILEIV
ncbi:MAG: hypothetical protein EKK64_06875 [Neisseriaceae bacterium]|nr:MAG: hypothetical protein EKK64_06875 [Neisseriaceae bacterium]